MLARLIMITLVCVLWLPSAAFPAFDGCANATPCTANPQNPTPMPAGCAVWNWNCTSANNGSSRQPCGPSNTCTQCTQSCTWSLEVPACSPCANQWAWKGPSAHGEGSGYTFGNPGLRASCGNLARWTMSVDGDCDGVFEQVFVYELGCDC